MGTLLFLLAPSSRRGLIISQVATKLGCARLGMYAVAVVFQETKHMKKVLLSLIVLATLAGAVTPAHAYKHCWVRHHHRHCRR
jgi:hypothetical protein